MATQAIANQLSALGNPFYYLRSEFLPKKLLNFSIEKLTDAAEITLPFLALRFPQIGSALSFTSAGSNLLQHGYELIQGKDLQKHVWNIVKNGAEIAGTALNLKTGLVVRHIMDLVENIGSRKVLSMYSNLLYLLSFLPVSKKTAYWLGFSSAAYQVFLNFYQSAVRVQVANKSKTTGYDKNVGYAKAASQALLGLYMAKRAFDFYRIANLVQYFILTRGGHHKTGLDGSLDERGVNQVERMASSIKEQVVDKLGITEATYVASSQKSSGETAEILAKNLEMKMGVTSNGIFLVPETRERIESPVQKLERKERAKHPVDIAFKQLTPYQQWVTPYEPTDPNCESSRDMYVRLKGAIRGFFANCDFNPRRLTVFVTHGTVMQNYLRGLNQRYPSAAADAFIEERYGEGEGALLSRDIDGKVKAVARYEFRKNEQVYPKQQPTPAIDTGTPVNSVAGDTAVPSSSNDVFML